MWVVYFENGFLGCLFRKLVEVLYFEKIEFEAGKFQEVLIFLTNLVRWSRTEQSWRHQVRVSISLRETD